MILSDDAKICNPLTERLYHSRQISPHTALLQRWHQVVLLHNQCAHTMPCLHCSPNHAILSILTRPHFTPAGLQARIFDRLITDRMTTSTFRSRCVFTIQTKRSTFQIITKKGGTLYCFPSHGGRLAERQSSQIVASSR
jgi:hypothetical protein